MGSRLRTIAVGLSLALPAALPSPADAAPATRGKSRAKSRAMSRGTTPAKRGPRSTVPEGTAVVTAALLNYADGKRTSKLDGKIAKALDKLDGGRAAAKRLAKRIRAQPTRAQRRVTGRHHARLGGETLSLGKTVDTAIARGYLSDDVHLFSDAITLPAEDVDPLPSDVRMNLTGVRCTSTDDTDGTDELVILVKKAKIPSNSKFTVLQPAIDIPGTLEVSAGSSTPTSEKLWLSNPSEHVLVTAVAEADGDAELRRQELEVAMDLATMLAVDMANDTDPAGALMLAIDYAHSMLSMADPSDPPSLQAKRVTKADLLAWWSGPPTKAMGLQSKATAQHRIGDGDYTLSFDVPSAPNPHPMITVSVAKMSTQSAAPFGRLKMHVSIRGAQGTHALEHFTSALPSTVRFRRRVAPGVVPITVSVDQLVPKIINRPGPSLPGSDEPQVIDYDVKPGTGVVLELLYNPETNQLSYPSGAKPVRDAKGYYTFEGSSTPTAKLRLSVSDTQF